VPIMLEGLIWHSRVTVCELNQVNYDAEHMSEGQLGDFSTATGGPQTTRPQGRRPPCRRPGDGQAAGQCGLMKFLSGSSGSSSALDRESSTHRPAGTVAPCGLRPRCCALTRRSPSQQPAGSSGPSRSSSSSRARPDRRFLNGKLQSFPLFVAISSSPSCRG
jgi:hypothetical protein